MARQINWEDFDSFGPVLDKYMPEYGEGETMANQIATAVNKIGYRWFNDGDTISGDCEPSNDCAAGEVCQYGNWLDKNVPEASAFFGRWIDTLIGGDCDEDTYKEFLCEMFETLLDEKLLEKYTDEKKVDSIYNAKTYANENDYPSNLIFCPRHEDEDGEEYEDGMEEDDW